MNIRSFVLALTLLPAVCFAQRKSGSPLDHLPPQIEVLTQFVERADISPDNTKIAFMDKSFGDAFKIDLKTRVIRCLTCNVPGAAFLRIMHLSSGDYILIGPKSFADIHTSRTKDNQLWFLSKQAGSKSQPFNEKMSEGAALSKKSMKISYSVNHGQDESLPAEYSALYVADVVVSGGNASLANKKRVYESKSKACSLEAQDFFDNDRKMTFTCYEPQGLASVMTIDLETGKVDNMSKAPGTLTSAKASIPMVFTQTSKQIARSRSLEALTDQETSTSGSSGW